MYKNIHMATYLGYPYDYRYYDEFDLDSIIVNKTKYTLNTLDDPDFVKKFKIDISIPSVMVKNLIYTDKDQIIKDAFADWVYKVFELNSQEKYGYINCAVVGYILTNVNMLHTGLAGRLYSIEAEIEAVNDINLMEYMHDKHYFVIRGSANVQNNVIESITFSNTSLMNPSLPAYDSAKEKVFGGFKELYKSVYNNGEPEINIPA